jgi:Pectate lyase superfamily protein
LIFIKAFKVLKKEQLLFFIVMCLAAACGVKSKIATTPQDGVVINNTVPNANSSKADTIGTVNVLDFGAIPNDNKDDSKAIQKAIDYVLSSNSIGKVYIPSGVFDMDNGIVVARHLKDGQFFFATVTITGSIPAFTSIRRVGNTTVFNMRHKGFGIAVQLARQVFIENIVFDGVARYDNDIEHIVNWTKEDWGINAGVNDDIYAPSCAIVIDPFHSTVPVKNRYANMESYYTNTGSGGSSMITIRGCAFSKQYIAIANNPSNGNANGDNIRAENCHITTSHTFWAAGQTQSRANSIENVYALFIHTFISNREIGMQKGTPPTVQNVNIAGFCKQVLNVSTDFSPINIYRSYMESIWSLGVAMSNNTSFDQCQIQFHLPDEKIFSPPFHLYNNNVSTFRDCSMEYFSNCNTKMPFAMHSRSVLMSGGFIQGGVLVANGYTNAGGDDLNKVTLDNVMISCLGKVAGKKNTAIPSTSITNQILMGGEMVTTTQGSVYVNTSTTYAMENVEQISLRIDNKTKKGFIQTKNPQLYRIGMNLFPETYTDASSLGINKKIKTYLGYVTAINGSTIEVSGIPKGLESGSFYIYAADFPQLNVNTKTKGMVEYKLVQ